MSTAFSDLYSYIRAVLGDNDAQHLRYANSTLDSHLTLFGFMNMPAYEVSGSDFVATLTPEQKAITVLEVAKGLISPSDNNFSYATPILKVARSGGVMQLLAWIDRALRKLYAGSLVGYSNEVDAFVQDPYDFINVLDRALGGITHG